MKNLRKQIFKRLFMGWAALSFILGTAVFYLEMEKVDKLVMGLALEESGFFTSGLDRSSVAERENLRQRADRFLTGHFVAISLYDENGRLILHEINPQKTLVMKQVEQHARPFTPVSSVRYRRFLTERNLYMQILLPLRDNNSRLLGYFDGIYQVDAKTYRNIQIDIVGTLLLVIVVCFITAVMLYPIIISLNRELIKLSSDLLKGNIELMDVLGSAIAKRDSDTNAHNYRVTLYAIRLAEAIGLDNGQIRNLIAGAFLHDVGKIGISDNILLKPDKLSEEEYGVMRSHVLLGLDIISQSEWLRGARDVIEFHHEKYDGTGYLKGLKGNEIPLNARIFTIVDVFDALTSRRPYKQAFSFDESMKLLNQDRGKRFDPELFDMFGVIAHGLYLEIADSDENKLGTMMNDLLERHFIGNG